MVLSAPPEGAETRTRFEPFSRWIFAFSLSVKMPVHSIAMSTSPQGSSAGLRTAVTLIGPRPTSMRVAGDGDRAGEAAVHRVVAHQVGVGLDRAEVVDRDHLDVGAARLDDRAQHVPTDAAEAVDCNLDRHVTPYSPCCLPSACGARRRASRRSLFAPLRVHPGSNRRSSAQVRANSAGPGYRPARMPASHAAPERGGFQHLRPVDRGAEGVGEALQHPVVGGHAAVDPQARCRPRPASRRASPRPGRGSGRRRSRARRGRTRPARSCGSARRSRRGSRDPSTAPRGR